MKAQAQRKYSPQEVDQGSQLVAPWDDPGAGIWEDAIVEMPEEYDGYVTRLQLGLCRTSITGEEIEENR